MKRVLIADDHSIVRTGISILVRDEFLNAEIDECADGDTVLQMMESKIYDLLILDISMPGINSITLLQMIFVRVPDQKVLILSMNSEDIYAKQYLSLGVKGFINKEAGNQELRRALDAIAHNKRYLSPRMRDILLDDELEGRKASPFKNLSARELQIMVLLLEGKNLTEISGTLHIHISTVSTHKARIMEKLGVSNLMQLNKMVRLLGYDKDVDTPFNR
jgi:DNA-binding NarL/FixJ family response regulator